MKKSVEHPLNPTFVAILEYMLECARKRISKEKVLTNKNPEMLGLMMQACKSIGQNRLTPDFWKELHRTDRELGISNLIWSITHYGNHEHMKTDCTNIQ